MKMGNRKFKSRLMCAAGLFVLCAATAFAQETDSTGFNALKYSMQKRYRPENAEFISERFTDNTFLRIQAGSWSLFRNSATGYAPGLTLAASYGKMLNPFNGLSLGFTAGELRRHTDGARVWNAGLDLSHSFSLCSCFLGYDPSRILDVSTVEGVELDLTRCSGTYSASIRAHLGVDFRAQVARNTDLFFQPSLLIANDGADHLDSPYGFHGGYALNFGLLTHFGRHRSDPAPESASGEWFTKDAFISFSAGAQFQASKLVESSIGVLPSSRESVAFSYGRLLTGPLSLRLSAFYGRDIWKAFSDGRQKNCIYGGLRGELMFDPLHWWKRERKLFSMPLMLGPEAGLMFKPDDGYTIRRLYLGLTGGVQMKLNFARHFGLYLEPRFSIVPYAWKSRSSNVLVTSLANWYDVLYSLQVGFCIPL